MCSICSRCLKVKNQNREHRTLYQRFLFKMASIQKHNLELNRIYCQPITGRDVNKDLTPKDKDKDKDLTPKDQDKDKDLLGLTPQGQGQGQGPDPQGPGQGQ